MIRVVWFIQGVPEFQKESQVTCATDFLQSLNLVGMVSVDSEEYNVASTEMVVDTEPYIAVLLEA